MIAAEKAVKLTRNEGLKESSPLLMGTISHSLADETAPRFSDDDYEFLKFHGIYQQDDRDQRKVAKHFVMMVRTKFPGGVLTAPQYLVCDRLSSQYGNNTMRITTEWAMHARPRFCTSTPMRPHRAMAEAGRAHFAIWNLR